MSAFLLPSEDLEPHFQEAFADAFPEDRERFAREALEHVERHGIQVPPSLQEAFLSLPCAHLRVVSPWGRAELLKLGGIGAHGLLTQSPPGPGEGEARLLPTLEAFRFPQGWISLERFPWKHAGPRLARTFASFAASRGLRFPKDPFPKPFPLVAGPLLLEGGTHLVVGFSPWVKSLPDRGRVLAFSPHYALAFTASGPEVFGLRTLFSRLAVGVPTEAGDFLRALEGVLRKEGLPLLVLEALRGEVPAPLVDLLRF